MTEPADRLAAALRVSGSDTAFGVPGGGPNLEVVGALGAAGIRFVLAHGESSACIMASAYGHLTGRPAATIVTRGPGATSAVNGAAQATLDRHPLVLVTDTVPEATRARVPHQRVDQRAMFGPVTKRSGVLHAGLTQDDLAAFIAAASAAPAGAVHLDYDAGATTVTGQPPGSLVIEEVTSQADMERAAALVRQSTRPVVIVGLGAANPARGGSLLRTLEGFGAPVFTTYQGVGAIPSEHPLGAGLFTNGASEAELLRAADLIVAIGLDMVEPIPAEWTYDAPVLATATTKMTDPYLPIAQEVIGEPAILAAELLIGDHDWPTDAGAGYREEVRSHLRTATEDRGDQAEETDGVDPVSLVEVVAGAAPSNVTATVDAGAHFLAVMPFWPVAEPGRLLISNGLATMGYAVPAAIGAALARPRTPVVCFVGDGGLGMTVAELETIARLSLPVTVVVFNDSALSLIKIKQRDGQGGNDAVAYRQTNFSSIATAMGVPGTSVRHTSQLHELLSDGWDRPRLLDVAVDPSSYPHLIAVTRG